MANLTFINKGHKELYLSRNYNSLENYNRYRDNAGFNDGKNSFSDYCFESSCSIWQNDKIKILSLPNKGKLFYLTNPNATTPIYADVTIGQLIIVRDLIDNKVLKFNAEGSSNNQFTDNYITEFKIERFCGNNSSNIIATVKLNMVDIKLDLKANYNIFIPKNYTTAGWEDERSDGSGYLDGSLEFTFSSIINASSGFVRFKTNGDNNEIRLQRIDGQPIVINQNIDINNQFRSVLFSSCSSPTQCMPVINIATYSLEYSLDGIFWIPFTIKLQ